LHNGDSLTVWKRYAAMVVGHSLLLYLAVVLLKIAIRQAQGKAPPAFRKKRVRPPICARGAQSGATDGGAAYPLQQGLLSFTALVDESIQQILQPVTLARRYQFGSRFDHNCQQTDRSQEKFADGLLLVA